MNECDDDNNKIFRVLFRSGPLPDDEWFLCRPCYERSPDFKNHRIREEKLN